MSDTFFGGGAILMGILIALTSALKWPKWLNYIWAAFIIVWGALAFAL